jgi:acetyl esterase
VVTWVRRAQQPRAGVTTLPLKVASRATRGTSDEVARRLVRPLSADGDTLAPQLHFALLLHRLAGFEPSPDPLRMRLDHRRAALAAAGPAVAMEQVTDYATDGPGGRFLARHYTPRGAELDEFGRPRPLVVYFHGGGFVLGDLDVVDHVCRLLAAAAGVHVFSADYRLAPEHPFPAAVDDAEFAFLWAYELADRLGIDAGRIAVAGDSAGATLAAAVCQRTVGRARLAGDVPVPAAQMLLYPSTYYHADFPSRRKFSSGYFLEQQEMDWFFASYVLAGGADASNPEVSPLLAPDLTGHPPAVVITAAFDPLRDEGESYGMRLRDAGVPVVMRRQPGMLHGFMNMTGISRDAHEAALVAAGSLAALLGTTRTSSAGTRPPTSTSTTSRSPSPESPKPNRPWPTRSARRTAGSRFRPRKSA